MSCSRKVCGVVKVQSGMAGRCAGVCVSRKHYMRKKLEKSEKEKVERECFVAMLYSSRR